MTCRRRARHHAIGAETPVEMAARIFMALDVAVAAGGVAACQRPYCRNDGMAMAAGERPLAAADHMAARWRACAENASMYRRGWLVT